MKKSLKCGISLVLILQLFACTNTGTAVETTTPETTSAPTEIADVENTSEIDYKTGTPWLNIDLDGVVTEDMPADVKDNFALYVNKDKILNTTIPEGYSYGGTIMEAMYNNNVDLKNMFVNGKAESHDAKLALDYL